MMLKIGIIGVGDIAQKAYLPVLCRDGLELHLFTRNQQKLKQVAKQYRIVNLHSSIHSIVESGIKGAFVHTSTDSHETIIEQLLLKNIHVYVDKPITYDYHSSKRLVDLAKSKGLHLMVGFNRRYAPAYRTLRDVPNPNMIIIQKNRYSLPGEVRTFVFDDFIHVLDTLRFLFNKQEIEILVRGMKKDGLLFHVVVQMIADDGSTAIGIMNRDAGVLEENVEVFSSIEKKSVNNLTQLKITKNKTELIALGNDWESTLYKRGFENIVAEFIKLVDTNAPPEFSMEDALSTHQLCEEVVRRLSRESEVS